MNFIKQNLKFIIGIGVLLLVVAVFSFTMKKAYSKSLDSGNLKDWAKASEQQRMDAIKTITGSDANIEVLTACVSRMAVLPDAENTPVKDAAALCQLGLLLNENT